METIGICGEGKQRKMAQGDREIAVMGKEGDIKTIWNPQNEDETKNARRTFDDMRKKKYLAFRVNAAGDKGEQITEFDPEAGKMIMVPPMVGG